MMNCHSNEVMQMPNRLIKDSIHESEKVSALSDFQFRIWVNLITYVDDYGRGDARPAIIKGRCFPLRDEIKAEDIGVALQQLSASGCIRLYIVNGMRYLCFPNWDTHQRIRTKVSKFPAPDGPDVVTYNSPQSAAECNSPPQNVSLNPNPNPESESESEVVVVNPFGDDNDDSYRPKLDTIFTYASSNLRNLTGGNIERLKDFMNDLPDDLIRYAIDKACGLGHPFFGYIQPILQQYVEMGFKTVADVEAYEAQRKKHNGKQPTTREYTEPDYENDW